jgi:hypothetical protein
LLGNQQALFGGVVLLALVSQIAARTSESKERR